MFEVNGLLPLRRRRSSLLGRWFWVGGPRGFHRGLFCGVLGYGIFAGKESGTVGNRRCIVGSETVRILVGLDSGNRLDSEPLYDPLVRWASSFHRWLVVYDFLYEPAGDFHTQQRKEFVHAAEVTLRGFLQRLQLTGFVTTE